ncbi:MAG: DUF4163 domain-containing protein [Bacteroidales bacterium]|nr:DUF4163 domain-containing protein [Bacteroidales bacterium]
MLISLILIYLSRHKYFRRFLAIALLALCVTLFGCTDDEFEHLRQVETSRSDNYTRFVSYSKISPAPGQDRWKASADTFNVIVGRYLDRLSDSLRMEADTLFAQYAADSIPRPAWQCQLYVSDTVFRADADYISVRLEIYSYRGGAHGSTWYKAFNYDVPRSAMMPDAAWLVPSDSAAVDALAAARFAGDTACFSVRPTLGAASCLNFTQNDVILSYDRYVLGPYACGAAEVAIPQRSLGKALRLE